MVAILYKQTQNAIWLLYYIYKHKNTKRDMVAILYINKHKTWLWLLYYMNKHKTRYGCYMI